MRVGSGFRLPEHSHSSIMQFDLACGCAGCWIVKGRRVTPQRVTAAVFYPRVPHGYEITAARPDAELYSFKLPVAPSWPAVRARSFPALVPNVAGEEPLVHAFRRLARLASFGHSPSPSPLTAATLCEILCCWPANSEAKPEPSRRISGAADDERLELAAGLIERHTSRPPSLAELADAAHLSERHLVRRFLAVYGCSPHDYTTRRRVERSAELLVQPAMTVTAIAEALGFPTIHAFSRWFRRETGATPMAYRKKPGIL